MKNKYPGIDEFIIVVIEKEVRKLEGRYGIAPQDLDDLQQELHMQVWRKLSGEFTPDNPGYRAAVRRTVDCRIKDIIEHYSTQKRRHERGSLRLDAEIDEMDGESACFADLHDIEDRRASGSGVAPAWHTRRAAKLDLEESLAELPDDLRQLADAIEALGGNLSAAARALGVTRKKIRCDVERLKAGLKSLRDD